MKRKKDESQIVTRLKSWIKEQGLSSVNFSLKIGKSRSYISCMSKAPSPEALDAIMKEYPNFPRAWVMFGDEAYIQPAKEESIESNEPITADKEDVEKRLNEQIQETNKWKKIAYHFKAAFEASCGNMDATLQDMESLV